MAVENHHAVSASHLEMGCTGWDVPGYTGQNPVLQPCDQLCSAKPTTLRLALPRMRPELKEKGRTDAPTQLTGAKRREWMGCWGLLGLLLLVIMDHSLIPY